MKDYLLGIDLGGTNIKIGCFDTDLTLIGKISVPTLTKEDAKPEDIVEQFYSASIELLKQNTLTLNDVCAIGIGSPGPVDVKAGVVQAAPNFPLFRNVPLKDMVAERFGKPTILENDANAACWAEYVIGAAKGFDHMIAFTLGTGIGGGIVCEGKLIHGPIGGAAELGHLIVYPDGRPCPCGQNGCVEAYASANSTAARATEAVKKGTQSTLSELLQQNGEITCKDVFDHAEKGDNLANEIVDGTAKALAIVCTQMVNTTDPQCIVFAGGMIAAGDFLLDRIRKSYKHYIGSLFGKGDIKICFATVGEDAGIIGAAALAPR
jgi:glucokinase